MGTLTYFAFSDVNSLWKTHKVKLLQLHSSASVVCFMDFFFALYMMLKACQKVETKKVKEVKVK